MHKNARNENIRTRRGTGTTAISGSGAGGSDRGAAAGGGRSDGTATGLVALGGWGRSIGGAIEGSPESVLGTTSGRGVSCRLVSDRRAYG
jgi:hypothetical protein